MIYSFLEFILLIGATCLDNLIVSILYSYQKIKISNRVIVIINFICSISLLASILIGSFIKNYISVKYINCLSFCLLFLLGIIKLFDSFIKNLINKRLINKTKCFKLFNLKFIIQVYGDFKKADQDLSNNINIKEAIVLAITLSLDSLSIGIGYGLTTVNYLWIIFVFLIGISFFYMGKVIGKIIPQKYDCDLSWVSGVMLIFLSFFKL